MQSYCQYHDIILCRRHADDCLGGERCEAKEVTDRDRAALQLDPDFCSVCSGVILAKAQRSKPSEL